MKIYKLKELSDSEPSGEYTFRPPGDTGLSITYLRFRETNEKKDLNPTDGFKGIAYVLKGEIKVTAGSRETNFSDEFSVTSGEAFELDGNLDIFGENLSTGESVMILTSGPTSKKFLNELDNSEES